MKKKTRLLKNIKEEFNTHYRRLESSQEGKFTYYLMGLIIDHIEHNYNDEEDKFVKEIMKYPDPLKSLHDRFEAAKNATVFAVFYLLMTTFLSPLVRCDSI